MNKQIDLTDLIKEIEDERSKEEEAKSRRDTAKEEKKD